MTTTRKVDGASLTTGLYRHIRSGGLYTVLGLVRHHESGAPMVIYFSHGHGTLNTRPLRGFATSRCSDPDGFAERFEFLADATVKRTPAGQGVAAVVFWANDTLLRNFALFDAALVGVGKPPANVPPSSSGAKGDDDDHHGD
jgi:hypothetical protein